VEAALSEEHEVGFVKLDRVLRFVRLLDVEVEHQRRYCRLDLGQSEPRACGDRNTFYFLRALTEITSDEENRRLPMHCLGPSPKAMKESAGRVFLASSVKRSGSNTSGSGKYLGSWCRPYTGMMTWSPTRIFTSLSGRV
jgi:hypothetical protein